MNDDTARSLTDTLRAATAAINRNPVSTVPDAVAQYAPQDAPERIARANDVVSHAIVQTCEATARVIEEDARKRMEVAEAMDADSRATAESIRKIGELEAKRNTEFLERMAKVRNFQDQIFALFRPDSVAQEMDQDFGAEKPVE